VAALADTYGQGALAGAGLAGLLLLIASIAIPSFRPASAHHAAVH
jgi:hypothetical protein